VMRSGRPIRTSSSTSGEQISAGAQALPPPRLRICPNHRLSSGSFSFVLRRDYSPPIKGGGPFPRHSCHAVIPPKEQPSAPTRSSHRWTILSHYTSHSTCMIVSQAAIRAPSNHHRHGGCYHHDPSRSRQSNHRRFSSERSRSSRSTSPLCLIILSPRPRTHARTITISSFKDIFGSVLCVCYSLP
jgi:hypothetical protein